MALSTGTPSPGQTLLAKVVDQEEQYGAEEAQLYAHDFDEISAEEEWALDDKSYHVMRKSLYLTTHIMVRRGDGLVPSTPVRPAEAMICGLRHGQD